MQLSSNSALKLGIVLSLSYIEMQSLFHESVGYGSLASKTLLERFQATFLLNQVLYVVFVQHECCKGTFESIGRNHASVSSRFGTFVRRQGRRGSRVSRQAVITVVQLVVVKAKRRHFVINGIDRINSECFGAFQGVVKRVVK